MALINVIKATVERWNVEERLVKDVTLTLHALCELTKETILTYCLKPF